MKKGYFLNPSLIKEILAFRTASGENLLVFEPLADACARVAKIISPNNPEKLAGLIEEWCSSNDFVSMLEEADKSRSSISVELARESLSQYSGSESFAAGASIDQVLTVFSALLRAELRTRESRSSAYIDELFLYQSSLRELDLHDLALLLLASCASKNVLEVFDRLLLIKEEPKTLVQVDPDLLTVGISPQFLSGLRMFALRNFEGALKAFSIASQKESESPSACIALFLVNLFSDNLEEAQLYLEKASEKTQSGFLLSLRSLQKIKAGEESLSFKAEEASSVALTLYFLKSRNCFDEMISLAKEHLEKYPADIVVRALYLEALILPVKNQLANDAPLSGSGADIFAERFAEAESFLLASIDIAGGGALNTLKTFFEINLAVLYLLKRDFAKARTTAATAIEALPSSAVGRLNYAISMLATGDLPELMQALSGLSVSEKVAYLRLTAEGYYHACLFEDALSSWKELIAIENERLWRLRTLCRMLEVYRLLRDTQNAQAAVNALLQHYQGEPETLFALAYELWQMGKTDEAIEALRDAKTKAGLNLKKWIAWQLGRVLFDADQVLSATDEYSEIVGENQDSVQAREFAVALFKAGLLPAAYERAKSLRLAAASVIPGITEIEADYLVRVQELAEAKELLLQLSKKRPLSVLNRLAIVRICLGLNDEKEAVSQIRELLSLPLSSQMRQELDELIEDSNLASLIKEKEKGS